MRTALVVLCVGFFVLVGDVLIRFLMIASDKRAPHCVHLTAETTPRQKERKLDCICGNSTPGHSSRSSAARDSAGPDTLNIDFIVKQDGLLAGSPGSAIETLSHRSHSREHADGAKRWKIDPKVRQDQFFAKYPDPNSRQVQNAKFLAHRIKEEFKIVDFDVFRNGTHLGVLPAYYLGFPKCGSTSTYNFITTYNPCVPAVTKEQNFWNQKFSPECATVDGIIKFCSSESIVRGITEFAGKWTGELAQAREACPTKPYLVDGSIELLFSTTMKTTRDKKTVAYTPLDYAVLIHELLPKARFIASVRAIDTSNLRSHYWYFARKDTLYSDYEKQLRATLEFMDRQFAGTRSPCQTWYASAHNAHPRMHSFPTSCNLQRLVQVFGADALFITDVQAVLSLEDGLLERFFGLAVDKQKVMQLMEDIPYISRSYPRKFSDTIQRLEDQLLSIMQNNSYPLLRS